MPARLVRASVDQPAAWDAFIGDSTGTPGGVLSVDLAKFPYVPGGGTLTVRNVEAVAQGQNGSIVKLSLPLGVPGSTATYTLTTPDATSVSFGASTLLDTSKTPPGPFGAVTRPDPLAGPWLWTFTADPSVDLSGLVELWLRVTYTQGA
jgi:hypothetical protein